MLYKEVETSSQKVSIESMMLSCKIDALVHLVSNIIGAYLHSDVSDYVHMLLKGTIAKLIVN